MSGHVWHEVDGRTDGDGFYRMCKVCGQVEGSHEPECPRTRDWKIPTRDTGMKFDGGKLDWWLVPRSFEHVVRVLMYGAEKYAPDNWRKVQDWRRRYYNAARRHLEDWRRGERNDPESGLPHLAHAVCCALFMLALDEGD